VRSHPGGELQWDAVNATTFLVSGDLNGDGSADFSIRVNHAATLTALTASDFFL
jgi:hypothetical protein